MKFFETPLKGAFVIDIELRRDVRGFFARAWCTKEFSDHGLNSKFVQANLAGSVRRGTTRGLHYQVAPCEEAKLVRCTKGAIFDVIVDVRPGSPTEGDWYGAELTADSRRMVFVPEGFAHGYQTLTDDTEVFYQVSQEYSPEQERGIRWDDAGIGVAWPIVDGVVVSDKDRNWPDYVTS